MFAFESRKYSHVGRNYTTTQRELATIVHAMQILAVLLKGG